MVIFHSYVGLPEGTELWREKSNTIFLGTRDEDLYIAGKLIELNRECSIFSMPRLITGGYMYPIITYYYHIISQLYPHIVIFALLAQLYPLYSYYFPIYSLLLII